MHVSELLSLPANEESAPWPFSRTRKVSLLASAAVNISANSEAILSLPDEGFASASTDRSAGFLEICALSSDKQEAAGSSCGSGWKRTRTRPSKTT